MRKFLVFAGLGLLAGCAYPSPSHVAALNAMVGRSEADLVRAYGVPVRSTETGGSKFDEFSKHRIESFPAGPYWGGPWGWGGWGWGGGWGGYADVQQYDCNTTFEIRDGVVKGWTLRGNAC
jgi:hypothetical protein